MEITELKQTDWYKDRPKIIQEAIELLPPTQLYKLKSSGKQCQLFSYQEPDSGKFEDITVTIQKTGIGGAMDEMGLGSLDTNQVFGIKLNDLEVWE